jgi:hypothetical protein
MAASGFNLKQFSKMGDIFKEQVSLTPRILTRSCKYELNNSYSFIISSLI